MTFLFDIGKVILDFDFETSLSRLLSPGIPVENLHELLGDKDAFERGDIPLDDYIDQALAAFGPDVTREAFKHAWRDIFTPNLPMWAEIERLSDAGHRLLLFSNTNAIHTPWILENYAIFSRFEAGTYSFEANSMKPEESIYKQAITDHGLEPAQTLYIDDLPGNIDTGALARRIHEEGFETGVDLDALDKAGAYAQEIRAQAAAGEGAT